jgi:hypothetical protein
MKKYSTLILFILAASLLPGMPVLGAQTFSLTLDGLYSRNLSGLSGFDNGLGGSVMFEFQPADSFSVGIGAEILEHFGDPSFSGQALFETVNLAGRYLPFAGTQSNWRPFITAGAGINPKVDIPGTYLWPGGYKILAGVGTWYHLSPQWALEIAALYNYYDFPGSSIQTLNAKLGLSCFFGRSTQETVAADREDKKSSNTKTVPAEKTVSAKQTPSPTVVIVKTPASRPQANGEQPKSVESAKQEIGAPAAKSQASGEQAKRVESAKKETGTPASRPQAEKQAVGVPISKKETGTKVAKKAVEDWGEESDDIDSKDSSVTNSQAGGEATRPEPIERIESGKKEIAAKAAKSLDPEDWGDESDEPAAEDSPSQKTKKVSSSKVAPVKTPAPAVKTTSSKTSVPAPTPALSKQSASNVPTVSRKPLDVYVFRESDTLWDIAARKDVYDDPELFPLLVNANFKSSAQDTDIPPGTKLVIPRGLTAKDTMSARMKAWALEYVRWRGKKINQKLYEQWVDEKEMSRLNPKQTPGIEYKSWEERPEKDQTGDEP